MNGRRPYLAKNMLTDYVKQVKDATITIYPEAHHNFDHKPDASAPRSVKSTTNRSKCRFVEKSEYNLVELEKDKKQWRVRKIIYSVYFTFSKQKKNMPYQRLCFFKNKQRV